MKYYKKVDKKMPRFRYSKYRYNLVNKDLYDKFIQETGIKVSWTRFKELIGIISDEIAQGVISERDGILLPKSMGKIWMGLFPLNKKSVAYLKAHATTDLYHNFFKTEDGKVVWDFYNVKYKVDNRQYYAFKPYRDFKTLAHLAFLDNPDRYKRRDKNAIIKERRKNHKAIENEYISEGGDQPGENSEQGS